MDNEDKGMKAILEMLGGAKTTEPLNKENSKTEKESGLTEKEHQEINERITELLAATVPLPVIEKWSEFQNKEFKLYVEAVENATTGFTYEEASNLCSASTEYISFVRGVIHNLEELESSLTKLFEEVKIYLGQPN